MVRLSLVVEGSLEELKSVLLRLEEAGLPGGGTEPPPAPAEAAPESGGGAALWTEGEVRRVWESLEVVARNILRKIAKEEGGYGWDRLKEEMGLSGNAIGGYLSSIGHELRIAGLSDHPHPLRWTATPGYLARDLDPVWRETVM